MHNNYQSRQRAFAGAPQNDGSQDQTLWKLLLVTALAYIVWNDIHVTDHLANSLQQVTSPSDATEKVRNRASLASFKEKTEVSYGVELPRSAKSPLAFAMDPGFAERYYVPADEVAEAMRKLNTYTEKYAAAAVAEAKAFGIPASITLAQGLLESGVGGSRLALSSRNHFGIKCFSRTCRKGHCVNFTDDTHKDFFVKYSSVWESYRAHSRLLKSNARYHGLFRLAPTDFEAWAKGLSKQGYATDPRYAQKIIAIIKTLKLDRYDRA